MIIEIGTSDFRTEAGKSEGIFIEPVKYYFDRLPDCNKENVAISNKEGEIEIYYLTDEEIEKHNLPQWIRGCNSINKIHPTTKTILEGKGLEDIVRCDRVKVVRIKSIIEKYNVTHIDMLKVDTEGHDTVIVNDYLDTIDFLPEQIMFENNQLSNRTEVTALIDRLTLLGYECEKLKTDVIATLC
jgi:FkbM family methyltransferase